MLPRGIQVPSLEGIEPTRAIAPVTQLVPAAESAATAAASKAQDVATGAAAAASSMARSGVAAIQSAAAQLIPRNCSVGTKYICLGYSGHSDCILLPPQNPDVFVGLTSEVVGLETIVSDIRHLPSLETVLIVGTVLICLSLIGMLPLVPFARYILLTLSSLAFVLFLLSATFVWATVRTMAELATAIHAETETGPLFLASIITFFSGLFSMVIAIFIFRQ